MGSNSKKEVIRTLSALLKTELLNKNVLALVTSYGVIMGKPVAADLTLDKANNDQEYFAENAGLSLLSAIFKESSSKAGSTLSDDAFLLSDVTVYPQVKEAFKFRELIVFYGDVEAVTVAEPSADE